MLGVIIFFFLLFLSNAYFIKQVKDSVGIYYLMLFVCADVLQTKSPGVKSIISKASNAKADLFVEAGDTIPFGDLFLEVGRHMLLPYWFLLKSRVRHM